MDRLERDRSFLRNAPELEGAAALSPHLTRLNYDQRLSIERQASSLLESFEAINEYLKIPKDRRALQSRGSSIVGVGEHAIVLELPGLPSPAIVKILSAKRDLEDHHHYFYRGTTTGMRPNTLWETAACLRDLNIAVPFHHEMVTRHGSTCFACHVCPDLRENGRYRIHEADAIFGTNASHGLSNVLVSPLQRVFDESVARVAALKTTPGYTLAVDRHKTNGDVAEGVRRMFFVREDVTTGALDLVAGDLDHIRISNVARSEVFLDWLLDPDAPVPIAAAEISKTLLPKNRAAELF